MSTHRLVYSTHRGRVPEHLRSLGRAVELAGGPAA
jgi:hypothetical protein